MENKFELKLESDTFTQLRVQFDSMLQLLLGKMETTEAEEAKITIACAVKVVEHFGENGETYKRPSFDWDVQTTVQDKYKRSGGVFGDYQLAFDSDEKAYVMVHTPTAQERLENV